MQFRRLPPCPLGYRGSELHDKANGRTSLTKNVVYLVNFDDHSIAGHRKKAETHVVLRRRVDGREFQQ